MGLDRFLSSCSYRGDTPAYTPDMTKLEHIITATPLLREHASGRYIDILIIY